MKKDEECADPIESGACFDLFNLGKLVQINSCENVIPESLKFLDKLQCKTLGTERKYCAEAIETPYITIISLCVVGVILICLIWCCCCCCCAKCCACCCCNKHHNKVSSTADDVEMQPAVFQPSPFQ